MYSIGLDTVTQDGYEIAYVPKELRDYNMCITAVKQYGYILGDYVPEELRDYNMCITAVKQDGYALEFVPPELRDYKMCIIAVKQYSSTLKYVPIELRSRIKEELGFKG
jgi:hypothetical protein